MNRDRESELRRVLKMNISLSGALDRALTTFERLPNATHIPDIEEQLLEEIWQQRSDLAFALLRRLEGIDSRLSLAPRSVKVTLDSRSSLSAARKETILCAKRLGFSRLRCTRVATAVSELCRNVLMYAGEGKLSLIPGLARERGLTMVVSDSGPGIENIDDILSGQYSSNSGMGLGLRGVQNISTKFNIESKRGLGTTVTAFFAA